MSIEIRSRMLRMRLAHGNERGDKYAVVAIAETLGVLCNNVANGNRELAAKADKEAKMLMKISQGMQKLEKMAKRSGR